MLAVRGGRGSLGANTLLFPAEQRDCFVCRHGGGCGNRWRISLLSVMSTLAAMTKV
jgi:hypothetical protein